MNVADFNTLLCQLFSVTTYRINQLHFTEKKDIASHLRPLHTDYTLKPTPNSTGLPLFHGIASSTPTTPSPPTSSFASPLRLSFKRLWRSSKRRTPPFFSLTFFNTFSPPSYLGITSATPKKLAKVPLPPDRHAALTALLPLTHHLQAHYNRPTFWNSPIDRSLRENIHTALQRLVATPTLGHVETMLPCYLAFLEHLAQLSTALYTRHAEKSHTHAKDYDLWLTFLTHCLTLHHHIITAFLPIYLFKYHLLASLRSPYLPPEHPLYATLTATASILCTETGLLQTSQSLFNTILTPFLAHTHTLATLPSPYKNTYFATKKKAMGFHTESAEKSHAPLCTYLSLCFNSNAAAIGDALLKHHHHALPLRHMAPTLATHLTQAVTAVTSQAAQVSLESSHTVLATHPFITAVAALGACLYWTTLLQLYLAQQARYTLITDCLIAIEKKHALALFSAHYLGFFSHLLQPKPFYKVCTDLVAHHPASFLNQLNHCFKDYPSTAYFISRSSPVSHLDRVGWANSMPFINRWLAGSRAMLLQLPSQLWQRLFAVFTNTPLRSFYLLQHCISTYTPHTPVTHCIDLFITQAQQKPAFNGLLFETYAALQHHGIPTTALHQHQLYVQTMAEKIGTLLTHCRHLYRSDHVQKLAHLSRLTHQFITTCSLIHHQSHTAIVGLILRQHVSSWVFLLSVILKHQLAISSRLLQCLALPCLDNPALLKQLQTHGDTLRDCYIESEAFRTHLAQLHHHKDTLSRSFLTVIHAICTQRSPLPIPPQQKRIDSAWLIQGAADVLCTFYTAIDYTATTPQPYQFIKPQRACQHWLTKHSADVFSCFDSRTARVCTTLYTSVTHKQSHDFFKGLPGLESILFSNKWLSINQRILLAHWCNCAIVQFYGLDTRYALRILTPTLFHLRTTLPTSVAFLTVCFQQYRHQLEQSRYVFSEQEQDTFTSLIGHYHTLCPTLDIHCLDVIYDILTVLATGLTQYHTLFSHHSPASSAALTSAFTLINDGLQHDTCWDSFLTKCGSLLLTLLELGILTILHPLFHRVQKSLDSTPYPGQPFTQLHAMIGDYIMLDTLFSPATAVTCTRYDIILDRAPFSTVLASYLVQHPGRVSAYIHHALHRIKTKKDSPESATHARMLNDILTTSLTVSSWCNTPFCFALFDIFYTTPMPISTHDAILIPQPTNDDYTCLHALCHAIPEYGSHLLTTFFQHINHRSPLSSHQMTPIIQALIHQKRAMTTSPTPADTTQLLMYIQLNDLITRDLKPAFSQVESLICATSSPSLSYDALPVFITQIHEYLIHCCPASRPHLRPLSDLALNDLVSLRLTLTTLPTLSSLNESDIAASCAALDTLFTRLLVHDPTAPLCDPTLLDALWAAQPSLTEKIGALFHAIPTITPAHFGRMATITTLLPLSLQHDFITYMITKAALFSRLPLSDYCWVLSHYLPVIGLPLFCNMLVDTSPTHPFLTLCRTEAPALFFTLMATLKRSRPHDFVAIMALFPADQQHEQPVYSLLDSSLQTPHPSGLTLPLSTLSNNSLHATLCHFCTTSTQDTLACLTLLFYDDPTRFWELCHLNDATLGHMLLQLIAFKPHPTCHAGIPILTWLQHPLFTSLLTLQATTFPLATTSDPCLHLLFVHTSRCMNTAPAPILCRWLLWCFHTDSLALCWPFFKTHPSRAAACFHALFFKETPPQAPTSTALILLHFLIMLPPTDRVLVLDTLHHRHGVTNEVLARFILESMAQCTTLSPYIVLTHTLSRLIRPIAHNAACFDPNPALAGAIGYAALCFSSDLTLPAILDYLKHCRFVPAMLPAPHIATCATLISDPTCRPLLTDLIQTDPALASGLLHNPAIAHTLKCQLYYQHLPPTDPLVTALVAFIKTYSETQLQHFLFHYISHTLSQEKQEDYMALIYKPLPPTVQGSHDHIQTLKTTLLSNTQSPLFQLATEDPITMAIFSALSTLPPTVHAPSLLATFPPSNMKLALSSPLSIQRQLNHVCQSKPLRMLFLASLQQSNDTHALSLFHTLSHSPAQSPSMLDIYELYLTDPDEIRMFHDYLGYIQTVISTFRYQNTASALDPALVFAATTDLLNRSPQPTRVIEWFTQHIAAHITPAILPTLHPLFSESTLHCSAIIPFFYALIRQHTFIPLLPSLPTLYTTSHFLDIWACLLEETPQHVILSHLNNPHSALHTLIMQFIHHILPTMPHHMFALCTLHYTHDCFLDMAFTLLYSHTFPHTSDIALTVTPPTSPLIQATKKALIKQETAFLFFLGRCFANYVLPNQLQSSWLIHCVDSLYQADSHAVLDEHFPEFLTHIRSQGLIGTNGSYLHHLHCLSWQACCTLYAFDPANTSLQAAFIQLKAITEQAHAQQQHALAVLSETVPDLIVGAQPVSTPSASPSHTVFHAPPTILDLIFSGLVTSQSCPAMFHDSLAHIFQTASLKERFVRHIKHIPSSRLLPILSHPDLRINERHMLLYSLFHDEKNRYHLPSQQGWPHLVAHTLLTDWEALWQTATTRTQRHVYLELLLFFFVHYPSILTNLYESLYTDIYQQTGLCFPTLFSCAHHLSQALASLSEPLTASAFTRIAHTLFEQGYSTFEVVFAFRQHPAYHPDSEKQWINHWLDTPQPYAFSEIPNWFYRLIDGCFPPNRPLYVPADLFNSTALHRAFKDWLITESLLDDMNCLSLTSLDAFKERYTLGLVYQQLLTACTQHSTLSTALQQPLGKTATAFFTDFFNQSRPTHAYDHLAFHQLKLLAHTLPYAASLFEKEQSLSCILTLRSAISECDFSTLMTPHFLPILATLSTAPSSPSRPTPSDFIPLTLNLSHSSFAPLSPQYKAALLSYFQASQSANAHPTLPSIHHYLSTRAHILNHLPATPTVSCIDTYVHAQQALRRSAFLLAHTLLALCTVPYTEGVAIFIAHCHCIHTHEWLLISSILDKYINGRTVACHLAAFFPNTTPPITQESLQKRARTLRQNTPTTPSLLSLFQTLRHHTAPPSAGPPADSAMASLLTLLSQLENMPSKEGT